MLPDFRFVIGAILATAFLGVMSVGLFATVRHTHQAKVGPLEASRTLAFGDRADWNQFADPDAARRFDELDAQGRGRRERGATCSGRADASGAIRGGAGGTGRL